MLLSTGLRVLPTVFPSTPLRENPGAGGRFDFIQLPGRTQKVHARSLGVFRQSSVQPPSPRPSITQICRWPAGSGPREDSSGPQNWSLALLTSSYAPSSFHFLCSRAFQPQFRGAERPWGQRPGPWRGYYSSQWFQ